MQEKQKSKKQLVEELQVLRGQLNHLKQMENQRTGAEEDRRRYQVGLEKLDGWVRELIHAGGDARKFNKVICAGIQDLVNADLSVLPYVDQSGETFTYHEALGDKRPLVLGKTMPLEGGGLCGWVAVNRKSLLVPDLCNDPRVLRDLAEALEASTGLLTPIWYNGEAIGGLSAFRRGEPFDEIDLQLLTLFSQRITFAYENMKILENLENLVAQRTADLTDANEQLKQEIEERRRAEKKVRQNEQQLKTILDSIRAGIIVVDPEDHTIVEANNFALELFNAEASMVIGHDCHEFFNLEGCCCPMAGLNSTVENLESMLVSKGDSEISVLKSVTLVSYKERVHFIESFIDISQLKAAEKQLTEFAQRLKRSNSELENFAYIASHDLQEPLRKIIAFGDRLTDKYREVLGEQGQDYLARMQGAAARMQHLIQDLLMYSRLTTKVRPFVPVDLNQVMAGVLEDLEVRVEEVGGEVEVGTLATVGGDPSQMRQLLQNLLDNALKFRRPQQPPVVKIYTTVGDHPLEPCVAASSDQEVCRITIEDNGIGFDPKYTDRIFGMFQRLHGRNEYEGTGIGLAVCRKIAECHGGELTVQSVLGQGSSFTITLPVKQTKNEVVYG